jgi:methionyl-tRNA formyltransferase
MTGTTVSTGIGDAAVSATTATTPFGRRRVVFVGAVHEARPALDVLLGSELVDVAAVVTVPQRPTKRLSGTVDLAGPAAAAGVPVIRTADVNAPVVVARIREIAPDLLVVVGWNQLVRRELLAIPRRGTVGFHASLLPRHRGHAPVNWAILRGETTIGNTMMMLDPGADTGDIVAQRTIDVDVNDTCATVYARVGQTGAQMLAEQLPALLAGTTVRQPQRPDAGDVLPRRTPDMGIIDWDQPARVVHDWVRALTEPYPGAFTMLDGSPVMVWGTRAPRGGEPAGIPGQVMSLESEGLRIGVRGGSILVTRMSAPGERPQHARRWMRRARVLPGTRFDPVPPAVARWARGEENTSAVAG